MQNNIAGPGLGLPLPANLYPSSLLNGAPFGENTNMFTLAAGQAMQVPAGTWFIDRGKFGLLQWFDPQTGIWKTFSSAREQSSVVQSDGFNIRIANLTGCPIAAVVTNGGSNYTQAGTTVVPGAGNSTWLPIIGGAVSTTVSITAAGSGYGMAPIVFIPAPPAGLGVQATAYAIISGGSITTITVTNQGAGYVTAPVPVILPNPADPNFATLTSGTAKTTLTGAGAITAVLCTNPGVAGTAAPSLTVSGPGTSGAATSVWMNTITATSITTAGAGISSNSKLTTVGGITAATPTWTNPAIELNTYLPRPADIGLTIAAGAITTIGPLYDSGLYTGTPTPIVINNGITTTAPTIALTLGGTQETVIMQQL